MSFLKKSSGYLLAVSVASLLVAGCGGGGSSSSTSDTLGGVAVDPYLSGCFVNLKNSSDATLAGPFTTGTDGSFTVTASTIGTGYLEVSGGGSCMHQLANPVAFTGTLQSPVTGAGTANITPITTLLQALVASGTDLAAAKSALATALRISEADLIDNPMSSTANANLLKLAVSVQTLIQSLVDSGGLFSAVVSGLVISLQANPVNLNDIVGSLVTAANKATISGIDSTKLATAIAAFQTAVVTALANAEKAKDAAAGTASCTLTVSGTSSLSLTGTYTNGVCAITTSGASSALSGANGTCSVSASGTTLTGATTIQLSGSGNSGAYSCSGSSGTLAIKN